MHTPHFARYQLQREERYCVKSGRPWLPRSAQIPAVACRRRIDCSQRDELGALVSLEMGKIKTEGTGEVQEFIDIVRLNSSPRKSVS